MSSTSRVPLLLKNKARKPTRLPIAPKAKPTNVDRTKRLSTGNDGDDELTMKNAKTPSQDQAANTDMQKESNSSTTSPVAPPAIPITVAPPPVTPTSTVAQSKPRSSGGPIAIGGSLTAARASSAPSSLGSNGTVRSSPILPVQRHMDQSHPRVERLAKITSAGPVYRSPNVVSPRLASRATVVMPPSSTTVQPSQNGNPVVKRMVRKLDIKPHQSPRRAAAHTNHHSHNGPMTTSPLLLAAIVPELEKELEEHAVLQPQRVVKERVAIKTTKKRTPDAVSEEASPSSRRRSLRRKVKRDQSYRDVSDSQEEPDDDQDEDVDPNELDLPEENLAIFVPARERATLWAKSVLRQHEEDEAAETALVVRKENPTRRKRSNSSASLSSVVRKNTVRNSKLDELLKKEPSQMTMGELALTVPKGRRHNRHEQEVAASAADHPANMNGSGSHLINTHALNRVRSLSVSSESAAMGGSLVTPQVQIVDGKMVVMESTVKLGEHVGDFTDRDEPVQRYNGSRFYGHNNGPGKRWSKEETKQFYYCLSQVGPNFSMMATLFPSRKRKELKCKFKYEEKHHPGLIEIALQASAAPLDTEIVSVISQMVDKETKKKQAKEAIALQKKQRLRLGSDAVSSPTSSVAPTPPPVQTDEFLDQYEDYYSRERKNSFDFAG